MQPFSKVTENQRWNRVEADLRPVAPITTSRILTVLLYIDLASICSNTKISWQFLCNDRNGIKVACHSNRIHDTTTRSLLR